MAAATVEPAVRRGGQQDSHQERGSGGPDSSNNIESTVRRHNSAPCRSEPEELMVIRQEIQPWARATGDLALIHSWGGSCLECASFRHCFYFSTGPPPYQEGLVGRDRHVPHTLLTVNLLSGLQWSRWTQSHPAAFLVAITSEGNLFGLGPRIPAEVTQMTSRRV